MLHNEARERLVDEGYEWPRNEAMTAEAYGVSERQVYKLSKQKRETGSVALRTSQRGRKPKKEQFEKIHRDLTEGKKITYPRKYDLYDIFCAVL